MKMHKEIKIWETKRRFFCIDNLYYFIYQPVRSNYIAIFSNEWWVITPSCDYTIEISSSPDRKVTIIKELKDTKV